MMQEPHCLNTSILDCSVTFTVDKDVWVHGIEVPSQVTDVPEELTVGETKITAIVIIKPVQLSLPSLFSLSSSQMEMMEAPVEGLPIITCSGSGYNELLYAHLLDNEVQKLLRFSPKSQSHDLQTDIVFARDND